MIENKVAKSGLVQVDLLDYKPRDIVHIDLKDQLWQELVIKESDFRNWIKAHDWSAYSGKNVALFCSTDAIIPPWAYMLVVSQLVAAQLKTMTPEKAMVSFWLDAIQELPQETYEDARIVVKGCGDESVPHEVYATFMQKVRPLAKSVLYGEPCSTVPLYKKKKA